LTPVSSLAVRSMPALLMVQDKNLLFSGQLLMSLRRTRKA
jgi:hypothetical protein